MSKNLITYNTIKGIFLTGLICLCSCVDHEYDLGKGTDMTMTVGGDLSVPVSSMEEILLKEILGTDENSDIIADENGDYSLVRTGNPSTTEIRVSPVNIMKEEMFFRADEVHMDLGNMPPGGTIIPIRNCPVEIGVNKIDVDDDIVDIDHADIARDESEIRLMLRGTTDNLFEVRKGFRIIFPEYMEIGSDESFCKVEGNNNVIVFTEDKAFENDRLPIKFYIRRIKFGSENARFNYEEHSLILGSEVMLDGELYYKGVSREEGIGFIPIILCEQIRIESARAKVNPEIDFKISPIDVGTLPAILTGDDVVLDATDPRLYLRVSNNSPMDVYVDMELQSEKSGTESEPAVIRDVIIPRECNDYRICIHQNRDIVMEGMDNVYCDNLGEIIKQIPEVINVKWIDARVNPNEYYDITLDESFYLDRTFEVNIPMMFGKETNIVYNKTLNGWSKDMKNASFEQMEVYIDIQNRIPMTLDFSAKAIDTGGNVMENVKISVDGEMEAGNGDTPKEKELFFTIESADGSVIDGMDGIKLKVKATATDETGDITLNENQTIKLKDIRLKLLDGVTMDWN